MSRENHAVLGGKNIDFRGGGGGKKNIFTTKIKTHEKN
jgi:hypothetical protein